jgi:hypothetical protein
MSRPQFTGWWPNCTLQESYTLLVAAQASLDDAIVGDPITSPVALAAILDFFAGQLAVPPDADTAVTVLQDVQVDM